MMGIFYSRVRLCVIFGGLLCLPLLSCNSAQTFSTDIDTEIDAPTGDASENTNSDSTEIEPSDPDVGYANPEPDTESTALTGYQVVDGEITKDGNVIYLKGINWFGFETSTHVVHGLWARSHSELVAKIKSLGFNAVRLPFCPDTLAGVEASSINSSLNGDLTGLNSLELLDVIVNELDANGIYILFDHHRPDCSDISELWYTEDYSESDWISDLVFVAEHYKNVEHFVGIDLKNEPHGAATWGTGHVSTDWNLAVERASAEILSANPDILIFVEGIQTSTYCSTGTGHWWGGNFEPAACKPISGLDGKIIYSPHVYGPDVYAQSYFFADDFPDNMPAIWQEHFGFLTDAGYVVAPGEFGGKFGEGDSRDDDWQIAFIDWMIEKNICNFFYWSLNPNSGDTGGILADDWIRIKTAKYNNLKRLIDSCH